jgi:hypothetical protein
MSENFIEWEGEGLENQICDRFAISKFDNLDQDFLPNDCIEQLVTTDNIMRELEFNDDKFPATDNQKEIIAWIHTDAKTVFAISVQCSLSSSELLSSMELFQKCGFNNGSLPIENPRGRVGEPPPHFCSRVWTRARRYNFWKNQWKCLTPVFSPDQYDYNLSSECILPFTWKAETFKEGAFSRVYEVTIHKAHQKHDELYKVLAL